VLPCGADDPRDAVAAGARDRPDVNRRARRHATQRYRELASLVDPAVKATVRELGLVVSTFADAR